MVVSELGRQVRVGILLYTGLLIGVAAVALTGLEGYVQWRVALGSVFFALQALALWRLSRRFLRSALVLWGMAAGLVCWIWGQMAWQLWDAVPLATGLLGVALGATVGLTVFWIRAAWAELSR